MTFVTMRRHPAPSPRAAAGTRRRRVKSTGELPRNFVIAQACDSQPTRSPSPTRLSSLDRRRPRPCWTRSRTHWTLLLPPSLSEPATWSASFASQPNSTTGTRLLASATTQQHLHQLACGPHLHHVSRRTWRTRWWTRRAQLGRSPQLRRGAFRHRRGAGEGIRKAEGGHRLFLSGKLAADRIAQLTRSPHHPTPPRTTTTSSSSCPFTVTPCAPLPFATASAPVA